MATERAIFHQPATAAARPAVWPPDDTEESVVGTDLHQLTIINSRLGLNEIAAGLTPPGQPAPWQALSQTMVTGLARADGTRVTALPDVFVYPKPIDRRRGSVALAVDGPPVLVIEVLSDSTYESDLNFENGKGWIYARAGVREYLVLDPTGALVPERLRAWRLGEQGYRPWPPDAAGHWRSAEIAAAFAVEDGLPAVLHLDGRRTLREGEIEAELARLRQLVEELRRGQGL